MKTRANLLMAFLSGVFLTFGFLAPVGAQVTEGEKRLDLFSNYLKDPQYIDVNWEVFLLMKVNKYFSMNINTLLIYDHDIQIGKDTNGDGTFDSFKPRVQFKELFGLGLSFQLAS